MNTNNRASPSGRATRASTETASGLGHSAGIPDAAKFNLNDNVWVRLTARGRQILRADHEAFRQQFPGIGEFHPPIEHDGWSRWQLWNLMQAFGQHIAMGVDVPFETTILLDAQAIEARRAATTGAVEDESAVGNADAPKDPLSGKAGIA